MISNSAVRSRLASSEPTGDSRALNARQSDAGSLRRLVVGREEDCTGSIFIKRLSLLQQGGLPGKSACWWNLDDMNSDPGNDVKDGRRNQLHKVALWPPHVYHGTCTPSRYIVHTHTCIHYIRQFKTI